MAGLRRDSA